MSITFEYEEDFIRFWWTFPNFQGHSRVQIWRDICFLWKLVLLLFSILILSLLMAGFQRSAIAHWLRYRGWWVEPHSRHCVVFLSKTLYPQFMLSTGSTQEIVTRSTCILSIKWFKSRMENNIHPDQPALQIWMIRVFWTGYTVKRCVKRPLSKYQKCRSKVLQNAPRGVFCNTFDLH